MAVENFVRHGVGVDGHGAQTDFFLPGIQRLSGVLCLRHQQNLCLIKGLVAIAVGPPELWVGNGQFHADMIAAQIT